MQGAAIFIDEPCRYAECRYAECRGAHLEKSKKDLNNGKLIR